ncbi:hypothetical protein FE391_29580 [Nonomuraea sp. KC401]|uniref:hypothetical protein n=1 Tax=unclassified Nonomuraea TaxID=2593643 RepID=UPI0010FDB092|nr:MULTISPECIES: hypothetical protein [unclassified Nonomuraea]NBE97470.1 hypothetical protein [Nonomuraea sp. K271]TLF62723.1 hypothetical protein FE391_29580 [Nonomuraea sp. KC401]
MVETADAKRHQAHREAYHEEVRLLEVLESTYPGWAISADEQWWVAELRQPRTQRVAEFGIVQYVRRKNGVSLGIALERQAELLRNIGPALFL